MKKIVLPFLLALAIKSNATVRTVSNRGDGGAQFNNLQAAIDASQSGDTLYIHGSQDGYGNVVIADKALTLIGPGFLPSKENPVIATLTNISFTNNPEVPGDNNGSEVQGLHCSVIYFSSNVEYRNLKIFRNYLSYLYLNATTNAGRYSDVIVEGNYFLSGVSGYNYNQGYFNITIQNNVFAQSAAIYGFGNSNNVLVNHNVFYHSGKGSAFNGNCRNLVVSNNIFNKRNFGASDITFSTFTNNLTFDCNGTNDPWSSFNNVNGGGNISNQSPGMVSQSDVNAGKTDENLDFSIASGVAKNAASDGKDIGLLYDAVGSLNWNVGRSARLPIVVKMNISNPTVAPGQSLNVQVSAKKNN